MCGIVGYIGEKECFPFILEGLKRLEYRGYDSAGISTIKNKKLKIVKTSGRIRDLENLTANTKIEGSIGLGHTRWATHGSPTTENAHPHSDCTNHFAVVHNGIIENYAEIKDDLIRKGHRFLSETDTEVIPHLIEEFYNGSFEEAVIKTLKVIKGAYGLAIISTYEPDKIIIARISSPLVIGVGKNEHLIASDVPAILGHTKNVIYLDDGEIGIIKKDGYIVRNIEEKEVKKSIETIEWDIEAIDRKGFPQFMIKEIYEQPQAVFDSMRGRYLENEGIAKLGGLELLEDKLWKTKRFIILGMGTSYHAGLVGEYFFENIARIPAEVEYAAEFRYRNPIIEPETTIIGVSQSGETIDTLESIREAKRRGALCLGIVNVVGSAIARETEGGVYTRAGIEIGVASTKSFITQLVVFYLMSILMARRKHLSISEGNLLINSLKEIPDKIKEIIVKQEENIKKIVKKVKERQNFLFLGRGNLYPVALEGALKLKEISYRFAIGYSSAEMKHGPIALIDKGFPVIMLIPKNELYEKNLSNLEELKARGACIIAIITEGDKLIPKKADWTIPIPQTIEHLEPMLAVVPLQLFAYHMAVELKLDADKPRNLAKSVVVE